MVLVKVSEVERKFQTIQADIGREVGGTPWAGRQRIAGLIYRDRQGI